MLQKLSSDILYNTLAGGHIFESALLDKRTIRMVNSSYKKYFRSDVCSWDVFRYFLSASFTEYGSLGGGSLCCLHAPVKSGLRIALRV